MLMPRMKGPPGGPGYHFTKTRTNFHVLGTRAAAFLFLDRSAVCLLRARGRGIPSALGLREGMGGGGVNAVGHGRFQVGIRRY